MVTLAKQFIEIIINKKWFYFKSVNFTTYVHEFYILLVYLSFAILSDLLSLAFIVVITFVFI